MITYLLGAYWHGVADVLLSSFVQLEMEDGDEIDAMLHQTGGA